MKLFELVPAASGADLQLLQERIDSGFIVHHANIKEVDGLHCSHQLQHNIKKTSTALIQLITGSDHFNNYTITIDYYSKTYDPTFISIPHYAMGAELFIG